MGYKKNKETLKKTKNGGIRRKEKKHREET
jgi:hypothetical protein